MLLLSDIDDCNNSIGKATGKYLQGNVAGIIETGVYFNVQWAIMKQ
jgi:hypothetical protein